MDEAAQTAVIILHYGDPGLTLNCILSIFNGSCHPDIILIDNDPGHRFFPFLSECRSFMKNKLPCIIHYFKMAANTGFSKGVNQGINKALLYGKKMVLLLNNDTEVSYNFLKIIIQEAFGFRGITGAIEMEINKKGKKTSNLIFAGGRIVWKEVPVYLKTIPDSWDIPYETDFIRGSCMAISVDLIKNIGLLDESFFAYMEDVDYCIRAADMGYGLKIVPGAVLWHRVASSGDLYTRNFLMAANYVQLLFKHAKGGKFFTGMILSSVSAIISIVNRKRIGKFHGFVHGIMKITCGY